MSLPSWERGLKHDQRVEIVQKYMSLPSWERGLKPEFGHIGLQPIGRSPRGSVD